MEMSRATKAWVVSGAVGLTSFTVGMIASQTPTLAIPAEPRPAITVTVAPPSSSAAQPGAAPTAQPSTKPGDGPTVQPSATRPTAGDVAPSPVTPPSAETPD